MMIDYAQVSPIKTGRRDTLKVDDIIIFEFTTPFNVYTYMYIRIYIYKTMTDRNKTEIACIIFIGYL